MIERIYVHNYRCYENFTIEFEERSSVLVIGRNGTGKSTLLSVLEMFQKICRGSNRIRDLIGPSDYTRHQTDLPVRFEVEVILDRRRFKYTLLFEMPPNFGEARIAEEKLVVDGDVVYSRKQAQVTLPGGSGFGLDWHIVALPIIKDRPGAPYVEQIRAFFAAMIIIAPIPANMSGFSDEESDELERDASNFSSWFNSLLVRYPASYSDLFNYLTSVIPDISSFENVPRGESGKQLLVKFEKENADKTLSIDFKHLSEGEKCFFLSALITASNKANGPVFCMWDEPDNHLSLSEVGRFMIQLRKLTGRAGQLIATSHHPETIRRFSDENTVVFTRQSHLEPTVVRKLEDLPYSGDLIEALTRDEIIG